ncbi:hypothetical protein GCM10023187_34280 [Nibrella viscosa]|uniref:SpoVT-AbrB domain-containing protein n=1 Tax=Nibrella viscosa TaxID=1084524 RepID=A0ABP8KND2_9BACT
MQQPIRKIGNSQGILLPRPLLQQVGIEGVVDIEVTEGALVLRPVQPHPRAGWDDAFRQALERGDEPEADFFEGIPNSFDDTEWSW